MASEQGFLAKQAGHTGGVRYETESDDVQVDRVMSDSR
jgi:hypothetical protein